MFTIPRDCERLLAMQVTQYARDPLAPWALSAMEHVLYGPYVGSPKNVLDLGCGLGRVSVYLHWQLQKPTIEFILADTTEVTPNPPGPDCRSNLARTADFVQANGIVNYRLFDVFRDKWSTLPQVDLVISMRSVGFHYLIEKSLPQILPLCHPETTLVFGCRPGKYRRDSFADLFQTCRLRLNDGGQDMLILKHLRPDAQPDQP